MYLEKKKSRQSHWWFRVSISYYFKGMEFSSCPFNYCNVHNSMWSTLWFNYLKPSAIVFSLSPLLTFTAPSFQNLKAFYRRNTTILWNLLTAVPSVIVYLPLFISHRFCQYINYFLTGISIRLNLIRKSFQTQVN